MRFSSLRRMTPNRAGQATYRTRRSVIQRARPGLHPGRALRCAGLLTGSVRTPDFRLLPVERVGPYRELRSEESRTSSETFVCIRNPRIRKRYAMPEQIASATTRSATIETRLSYLGPMTERPRYYAHDPSRDVFHRSEEHTS